ncbi:MAG: aminomethyl-transferring glycine dehydrogenase [Saprospiraceae bacterium]|nr:aminomethyl-transferring glycine dehydrogenase [Saprospiraceae bacterium]MBK7795625.1 aminomethyl-transferring glycine dehydrogenase [Saprospiraceae bacterium]
MASFERNDRFENRHIGTTGPALAQMLRQLGVSSLDELIDQTVPAQIRLNKKLQLPPASSEFDYLNQLKINAQKNKVYRSFIGQGYYGTITPSVVRRNVFENPGWYTQYTPYQAEISQGRLEALLNFQTMISDLTGLPISNASLLDEGTAAAEAMLMFFHANEKKNKEESPDKFFVDHNVFDQTIDVLRSRAWPQGIEIIVGDWRKMELPEKCFGVLLQYPDKRGAIHDYQTFIQMSKAKGCNVALATDLLALCLLKSPGELGADVALGNSQRFGVPMGFGGPHAAFFATREEFKRIMPGRIIGVSIDEQGNRALRMALQTREQHIRREKATSNICTAQALLAIMASMYGVYHGPDGLYAIARRVHDMSVALASVLSTSGYSIQEDNFFDTVSIKADSDLREKVKSLAESAGYNFGYSGDSIRISLDETATADELKTITDIFSAAMGKKESSLVIPSAGLNIPQPLIRSSEYMTHDVFNTNQTESSLMRYIKRLENKDLSLVHSMISLGSCTMKLNAATELYPVSWPEFSNIHPFAPQDQVPAYLQIIHELEQYLCEVTGFTACSLQPNSGAQGEFAGLLAIKAYHESRSDMDRDVALIPSSAHGTNPASAVIAGMQVVVTACDENGNIIVDDIRQKAELYKDRLACLMVTYPSTHGVFETSIKEICDIIHQYGGMVYMDGANMNAQVGLTNPANIGADVCHLNLHKTFAIPHGGGGPGVGPICCNDTLKPFLPRHEFYPQMVNGPGVPSVSAAPYGSASILLISYAYIRMLGPDGLTKATKHAILNANYIAARLKDKYKILYTGANGRVAHELIVDLRPYKDVGVSAEDVAKRLMDYGFHAPTLSFPVAGTIMIEPTESEDKAELDRFCDALLLIREEIDEIARGEYPADNNVLSNAPHTVQLITADSWDKPYSRQKAAFPAAYQAHGQKFWPQVGRVNNAHGDRNLVCICPPTESYMQ